MRKLKTDELNRISIEDFKKQEKTQIVVVLDNIRSMHNIGSVFRTCDAFRIEKLVLCGITAMPPHREIQKTALDATESVVWEYYENTKDALKQLKNDKFKILGIEQTDNSISLEDFSPEPNTKYAVIFGNEINGVDENVLRECDFCIEIPQFGTKHSFNISVSAGIVLWDMFAKIKKSKLKISI